MKFSDEEIRNILELKEEITEKIVKCQEQIEKLEKSLSAVDTILKQSSFTKASEIISNSSGFSLIQCPGWVLCCSF